MNKSETAPTTADRMQPPKIPKVIADPSSTIEKAMVARARRMSSRVDQPPGRFTAPKEALGGIERRSRSISMIANAMESIAEFERKNAYTKGKARMPVKR